jgi:cytochrome c oxidase assembly protein subunit 15
MAPRVPDNRPCPPWLHAWAILTLAAAAPLVLFGAHVTTTGVGMVDPQGFRPPNELLRTLFEEYNLGFLFEYGHRLFGMLVGLCSIVLMLGLAWTGRTPGVRWIGFVAFAAVGVQGLLGKYRVDLNAWFGPNLALVHGLFAQLVLAVLVAAVVFTARRSELAGETPAPRAGLLPALLFLQIAVGAVVRHFGDPSAQRLHILFAFVVAAAALALVRGLWTYGMRRSAALLAGLVGLQIALGVEAWLRRFSVGMPIEYLQGQVFDAPPTLGTLLIRTAHFAVGAGLFAVAVGVALAVRRPIPAAAPRRIARAVERVPAPAFSAPMEAEA